MQRMFFEFIYNRYRRQLYSSDPQLFMDVVEYYFCTESTTAKSLEMRRDVLFPYSPFTGYRRANGESLQAVKSYDAQRHVCLKSNDRLDKGVHIRMR